jgi:Zn-dependent metalloprotease
MQLTTRRLSLIGISLLLANCGVADLSTDGESSTAELGAASAKAAAEKQKDPRSSLTAISAAGNNARRSSSGNVVADARAFAAQAAQRAGVKSPSFAEYNVAKGLDGLTHVRLHQMYEGRPVWGADVVVHASDSELTGLAGSIAANVERLDRSALARPAALTDKAALDLAKADRLGSRQVTTSRESVEKIVWLAGDGTPHVALHTVFYNELENGVAPGLWNHIFDETTGALLATWNGIDTVVQGSGVGGNAKFAHSWNQELDLEPSGDAYVATTTKLQTVNMANQSTGDGTPVTGPLMTFGDAAINDAHGYAEITLNLLSAMGHDSIDDAGYRIVSRVHYSQDYENAFWNGTNMTYGDGKTLFYPLSGALDVVAHEIHHGYTSKHSNLAYSGEPGGLNEGFSDIAGKTAEFFYEPSPTWDLGAHIFKQDNAALRYMCNPARDGVSIENAANMTPSLDPHYSSGVPNKFFCRLSKRFSSGNPEGTATRDGVRHAATAVYEANAHYWTSSSTFNQACQGTIDAARALHFTDDEVLAIRTSWVDVGVYCDGLFPPPPPCDETLTGATGTVTSPNYPNNYGDNFSKTWCIDAPAGTTATLKFDAFETESGYDFVTLGDKNGAVLSKTSGTTAPDPVTSTRIYITFKTDSSVQKKGWTASWTTQ